MLSQHLERFQEMVIGRKFASTMFLACSISKLELDVSELCNVFWTNGGEESSYILPPNLFPFIPPILPILSSLLVTTHETELMFSVQELSCFLVHLLTSPQQCGIVAEVLSKSEVDVLGGWIDYGTLVDVVSQLCW